MGVAHALLYFYLFQYLFLHYSLLNFFFHQIWHWLSITKLQHSYLAITPRSAPNTSWYSYNILSNYYLPSAAHIDFQCCLKLCNQTILGPYTQLQTLAPFFSDPYCTPTPPMYPQPLRVHPSMYTAGFLTHPIVFVAYGISTWLLKQWIPQSLSL